MSMKRWVPWLAVVGWACVAVTVADAAQRPQATRSSAPRLSIAKTEYDLGSINPQIPGRPILVTLRNTGLRPLEIRKIRTSCPCLKVDRSALTIQPQREATLRLVLDPLLAERVFVEEALIYSNDPVNPLSTVQIAGALRPPIMFTPEVVSFTETYRPDVGKLTFPPVRLTSVDGTPLGRLRIVPSIPSILTEARKIDDRTYEVAVRIDPSIPIGRIKESMKIYTEHPGMPVVEVPVGGIIIGDLDPVGRRLDFGLIKEGQPGTVTFLLRNWSTREVHVLRAEARLQVPADVQVTPEGKDFRILLSVGPQPAFTRLIGAVELHTDNPDQPLVRLQVGGGVLANHPFEQAAADGSQGKFLAIVNDALVRGDHIPSDRFFSDVLGGVKDGRAEDILLRALAEADVPGRMRAAELLAQFRTPKVLDRLRLASTEDAAEFVRRIALVAYTDAVGKAAIPTLLLALRDDTGWVREDAAIYLGKLGDAKVIPALRAALNDPDPDARIAVNQALIALQTGVK